MATQSYSVSSKPAICVGPALVGILDYMKTTGHKSNMSDVRTRRQSSLAIYLDTYKSQRRVSVLILANKR